MIGTRTRARLFDLVAAARPVMARRDWPLLAVAVGTVPLAIAYLLGTPVHQPLTGLLVAPLFWACVCEDRLGRAIRLVVVVMGTHSALAIGLSAGDPAGAAACLAGSEAYWEQTLHWVRTGEDPEYQWRVWLPRHLLLFGSMLVVGGLTLGIVPFARGVEQLDLMNFYVGRLAAQSDSPATALLFGWHTVVGPARDGLHSPCVCCRVVGARTGDRPNDLDSGPAPVAVRARHGVRRRGRAGQAVARPDRPRPTRGHRVAGGPLTAAHASTRSRSAKVAHTRGGT